MDTIKYEKRQITLVNNIRVKFRKMLQKFQITFVATYILIVIFLRPSEK